MPAKVQKGGGKKMQYLMVFVGALLFMYALVVWDPGTPFIGLSQATNMWAPVAYSLAVVETTALLLLSLIGLFAKPNEKLTRWMTVATVFAGLALFALPTSVHTGSIISSLSLSLPMLAKLIGFVLAYVGASWEELELGG